MKLVDLNLISANPSVHDVLSTRELDISLLQPDVGGIVSQDHLLQRLGQLLPACLRVRPQGLYGGEHDHGILHHRVDINYLLGSLLQLLNPGLQTIVLESMFSFLSIKETEHTDPILLSRNLSGTWYFSNFFLVIFTTFYVVLPPPPSFLSSFTLQEKTIRVLLISRRSRAQRTTTTDDPFRSYLRGLASG